VRSARKENRDSQVHVARHNFHEHWFLPAPRIRAPSKAIGTRPILRARRNRWVLPVGLAGLADPARFLRTESLGDGARRAW